MPTAKGKKNVPCFKHLICIAPPQNRVLVSLVLLESQGHFPDILVWMIFGKAIPFPF